MPVPTAYTETDLIAYLRTVQSNLADDLNLPASEYQEAVNDVLVAYGASDITSATDIKKLRALARIEAWRMVVSATAGDMNFSADGASYSRSQVHAQALENLKLAESDGLEYTLSYQASIGAIRWNHDPYAAPLENE